MRDLAVGEFVYGDGGLGDAVDVFEELFCEVVAVVDDAVTAEDVYGATDYEVLWGVEVLFF